MSNSETGREAGINPTVKRESSGKQQGIPLQKAPVHNGTGTSANSETGITTGGEEALCAACLPFSQRKSSTLRSMPPFLPKSVLLSAQHASLYIPQSGVYPACLPVYLRVVYTQHASLGVHHGGYTSLIYLPVYPRWCIPGLNLPICLPTIPTMVYPVYMPPYHTYHGVHPGYMPPYRT